MYRYFLLFLIIFSSITESYAGVSRQTPEHGVVVSAHPLATQSGIAMLEQGGNAFDAAAATALSLAVVEPGSSGIGGGGFFLLYLAATRQYIMIDARETSPKLAGHGEIYATQSSIDGPQSAGVPGLIAGIDHILKHYGSLPRATVAKPAIQQARDGFEASNHLLRMINWRKQAFNTAARKIFLDGTGATPESGFHITQPALAATLERYAKLGAEDFYNGETAKRLLADLERDGGLIQASDLHAYQAVLRQPVQFDYQGYHFSSAALPSSGGIVLAEIFGMLKDDDLTSLNETDRTHLLVEAMKRAYRDRNNHLGDADFVDIPDLLDARRLQTMRHSIRMDQATASASLAGHIEPMGNSTDTTHFSIIDRQGNIVSATLSINYGFGSGYVSPSTGILLNDEMDDFATQPGKPNAYGLVQGKANAVAPGKRMLSSMTPTIIRGKDRTFVVGTPGGSRIISMVLLAATDFITDNGDPAYWTWLPRFHHQFLPDVIQHEPHAFSPETETELKKRGHQLKEVRKYGNMNTILWDRKTNQLIGIPDPRGEGKAKKQM